ncbi:MAG: hypothetical protein J6J43_06715 [Oscillospiraceae bacterium]|nr:hypothetical protein [Oscillospiraceae bacterium]
MKITKMTAVFGCLDGAVLELSPGLNTICLPNEGGKSTWAAFLLAMFYGLDTKRAQKGGLSGKNRYLPWSGKPMEGTMELELEGRTVVLQRSSENGKPFGTFRAWDKHTGLQIGSLTGENCGLTLLGVEKEVFRRSAFLNGTELAVTQDHDLSRRLGNLAASGQQNESFLQADDRLRIWQNHLRYHQSGEIPRVQRQLEELTAAQARTQPPIAHLPSEGSLLQMLGSLQQQEVFSCPAALAGVKEADILEKTRQDLSRRKKRLWLFAVLAAVCLVGAALWSWWLLIPALAAGAGAVNVFLAKKLCRDYGTNRIAEIFPAAVSYRDREKRRWAQMTAVEEVRGFAPQVTDVAEAKQAVEQALAAHRQAEQIRLQKPTPEQVERLRQTLAQLEKQEQAVILARKALSGANSKLQQTYVPRLTALAGDCLHRLTLGRYDGIIMNESLELSVREAGSVVRPLAALSRGTQDQVWLALRLAMTKLLLPQGAPVVLDDALLTFDVQREKAALQVLSQEDRQVIVFSCR